MSLLKDREALQSEKQTYLERLQKLQERKDKVKPELFDKLRKEIDNKMVDVDARLSAVEQAIRAEERRLEEERRRQEEERRRQEEEERQRRAEEEKRRREEARRKARESDRRKIVLEKYAAELVALQSRWRKQQQARREELTAHASALREQRKELEDELAKNKDQMEELSLRKEIGEFEDNPAEYDALHGEGRKKAQGLEAKMSARDIELGKASEQIQEMDQSEMPDLSDEVVKNHADELAEPEPEEEVYVPEGELESRVIAEEEIGADQLDEGEELLTEVEEVYEDATEEAFFAIPGICDEISPCLLERLPDGNEKTHYLVLGGAKTMIGSNEMCEVHLPYSTVDSKHAWVKVDRRAQYLIKDLGSRTGTYINGKKIKKAYLENGDQLKIGEIRLVVKLA